MQIYLFPQCAMVTGIVCVVLVIINISLKTALVCGKAEKLLVKGRQLDYKAPIFHVQRLGFYDQRDV